MSKNNSGSDSAETKNKKYKQISKWVNPEVKYEARKFSYKTRENLDDNMYFKENKSNKESFAKCVSPIMHKNNISIINTLDCENKDYEPFDSITLSNKNDKNELSVENEKRQNNKHLIKSIFIDSRMNDAKYSVKSIKESLNLNSKTNLNN